MVDVTDRAIDGAIARGLDVRSREPRASSVNFDRVSRRIEIELANGCKFSFPADLGQGLAGAGDDDLADVVLLGDGCGLHWERLDVDLTVPGVMAGLFGTAAFMARRGGEARSPAKAAAARRNGAKGGRPRKVAPV